MVVFDGFKPWSSKCPGLHGPLGRHVGKFPRLDKRLVGLIKLTGQLVSTWKKNRERGHTYTSSPFTSWCRKGSSVSKAPVRYGTVISCTLYGQSMSALQLQGTEDVHARISIYCQIREQIECLIEYAIYDSESSYQLLPKLTENTHIPGSAITSSSGRPFFDHLSWVKNCCPVRESSRGPTVEARAEKMPG